jgi:uncharacterized membrane protein
MWWLFAIFSALASVGRNIIMKDLGDKLDEYVNVLGRFVFILPFALAFSLFNGIPTIPLEYWLYSLLAGFFVTVSTMFLSKAFKYSQISLTIALWKLNIIFILFLEIIFLKAHFTFLSILGIFITALGVYLLNITKAKASFLKPFSMLLTDKGMRYAFLSALTLAPSFLFFKITVDLTDPYFPAFTNYLFATLFTLSAVFKMSKTHYRKYIRYWKAFMIMGFLAFLSTVLATIGYKVSLATYVESVKQSEVLFTLLAGIIFFKEKEKVKEIWLGCCVIIAGIFLVILNS